MEIIILVMDVVQDVKYNIGLVRYAPQTKICVLDVLEEYLAFDDQIKLNKYLILIVNTKLNNYLINPIFPNEIWLYFTTINI